MSMGYDVFPLREFAAFRDNLAMFEAAGVAPDLENGATRHPTLAELRFVIRDLGCTIDSENMEGQDLSLWVRSPDAGGVEITLKDYTAEPGGNAACPLHFENGAPRLLVAITGRLARLCGSLLIVDSMMNFLIVEPGTDPDSAWVEP